MIYLIAGFILLRVLDVAFLLHNGRIYRFDCIDVFFWPVLVPVSIVVRLVYWVRRPRRFKL